MRVFPAFRSSSIVRHGAVTVLCGRLLAIEYIDLAEQSLQALEKLSFEHPQVRRADDAKQCFRASRGLGGCGLARRTVQCTPWPRLPALP